MRAESPPSGRAQPRCEHRNPCTACRHARLSFAPTLCSLYPSDLGCRSYSRSRGPGRYTPPSRRSQWSTTRRQRARQPHGLRPGRRRAIRISGSRACSNTPRQRQRPRSRGSKTRHHGPAQACSSHPDLELHELATEDDQAECPDPPLLLSDRHARVCARARRGQTMRRQDAKLDAHRTNAFILAPPRLTRSLRDDALARRWTCPGLRDTWGFGC
jgi:hypothetical protein